MPNKIEKYELQQEALSLSGSAGVTHEKIAEELTKLLDGQDSISQSTVTRFLQSVRESRAEQAKVVFQNYYKESQPKDLQQLEEVQAFFFNIFRGNPFDKDHPEAAPFLGENGEPLKFDLAMQSDAALKLVDIIYKKGKMAGLETDSPDGRPRKVSLTDNDGQSIVDTARSGILGLIGRLRETGITGPGTEQGQSDLEGSPGLLPG